MRSVNLLTDILNKQLFPPQRRKLAKQRGRCVRIQPPGWVWRITDDGRFVPVSALLTADADIMWQSGGFHINGDAALLRTLSDCWEETDIPVAISRLFGPRLAPHALYAIERAKKRLAVSASKNFVSLSEISDYGRKAQALASKVERLSKRLQAVSLFVRRGV